MSTYTSILARSPRLLYLIFMILGHVLSPIWWIKRLKLRLKNLPQISWLITTMVKGLRLYSIYKLASCLPTVGYGKKTWDS